MLMMNDAAATETIATIIRLIQPHDIARLCRQRMGGSKGEKKLLAELESQLRRN